MRVLLLSLSLLSLSPTLFADCHSDAKEIGTYYGHITRCIPSYTYYDICYFRKMNNAKITGSNGRCTASHVLASKVSGSIYTDWCTLYWDKGNWGRTIKGTCS